MKAVILAAGEGARMGPFTASVPKVLIPVGNRPRSYGVVTFAGKNRVGITEKPTEVISNRINTGAYAHDERIFEEIDRLANVWKHDLPSVVSALAQRTPFLALRTEGTWVDAL